mmetsp:Transcript_55169/g.161009  ORF Transcript_55169/g.161009 Transcript_55169/m.161009 type:complete len:241 (+) Transcript_55169:1463-2185(+)
MSQPGFAQPGSPQAAAALHRGGWHHAQGSAEGGAGKVDAECHDRVLARRGVHTQERGRAIELAVPQQIPAGRLAGRIHKAQRHCDGLPRASSSPPHRGGHAVKGRVRLCHVLQGFWQLLGSNPFNTSRFRCGLPRGKARPALPDVEGDGWLESFPGQIYHLHDIHRGLLLAQQLVWPVLLVPLGLWQIPQAGALDPPGLPLPLPAPGGAGRGGRRGAGRGGRGGGEGGGGRRGRELAFAP